MLNEISFKINLYCIKTKRIYTVKNVRMSHRDLLNLQAEKKWSP